MAIKSVSPLVPTEATSGGLRDDFADSTLCAAGLGGALGTAIAGAALLTAALPAQMLGCVTVSGGLYYAGKRKLQGKPIIPTFAKAEVTVEAKPVDA